MASDKVSRATEVTVAGLAEMDVGTVVCVAEGAESGTDAGVIDDGWWGIADSGERDCAGNSMVRRCSNPTASL